MYKVSLTYFKETTGKCYSSGVYTSHKEDLWEIFNEVDKMWHERRLPGLMMNHSPFITLVNVPDHPHDHPRLIGVGG